jgi:hypothetical protein
MSVSIGRAEELDDYWSTELTLNSSDISIKSAEVEHRMTQCDDYPYQNQKIITGVISHLSETRHGDITPVDGRYEYRSASGLFLLNSPPAGWPPSEEVFSALNDYLSDHAKIESVGPLDRVSLWEFFASADDIQEITYRGPAGEHSEQEEVPDISLDELYSTVLISADVSFKNNGEVATVHYDRGHIQIPRVSKELREYVLQLFERDVVFVS